MTFGELIENQTHAATVRRYRRTTNHGHGLVDLGAAVTGLIDIGVSFRRVSFDLGGGFRVERLGKAELEAVGFDVHLENLKRRLPAPDEPLEGEGFPAAGTP